MHSSTNFPEFLSKNSQATVQEIAMHLKKHGLTVEAYRKMVFDWEKIYNREKLMGYSRANPRFSELWGREKAFITRLFNEIERINERKHIAPHTSDTPLQTEVWARSS